MKYINHARLGIIAFEHPHNHKKMVELLGMREEDIVSAGFVGSVDPTGPHLECCGHSVSLNKVAVARDSTRVNLNVRMSENAAIAGRIRR